MRIDNTTEILQARINGIRTMNHLQPHQILLRRGEWKTPNSMGNRFADPENKPGVYCFIGFNLDDFFDIGTLLYIGSSKKIRSRFFSHAKIKNTPGFNYIQFHFHYCEEYIKTERQLINEFSPLLNVRYDG